MRPPIMVHSALGRALVFASGDLDEWHVWRPQAAERIPWTCEVLIWRENLLRSAITVVNSNATLPNQV